MKFDDLIAHLARLGCESWQDVTNDNRARLVRLYMQETGEWGDALFDGMAPVFDAFDARDMTAFGTAVARKVIDYVRPHVERELRKQTIFRREQDEIESRLSEIDPHWRERFNDWSAAELFYAKELSA
jgi:hypothetical protein